MSNLKTALLLVDIQNDFFEDGALPVSDASKILPVVNREIEVAEKNHELIIAGRDWHTVNHCSFVERGGPWPPHCIQDSEGAAFHPEMKLPDNAVRVSKGVKFDTDAYSEFDGTQLESFLERQGIGTLRIAGLALDVCVRATALEALRLGFRVELVRDGCRAVDELSTAKVLDELRAAGATLA